ncbi:hypothetical protein [Alteromonas ponticola]|uniref:Uncharacterized protein n=1 Tax=Alteromonas ponticola TaxID=2720613 RepID=A0ABX1R2R3_9ALTE|nr:hypothetical protein [Alteromonas ponticola]NMH60754.1 hypothetical protein [Alteromonas ponticola]
MYSHEKLYRASRKNAYLHLAKLINDNEELNAQWQKLEALNNRLSN